MSAIPVVVVGIHERNAPLDLLERIAITDRDLPKALQSLCDSPHLSEAVVLSTCMRTEVYAVLERFHDGLADIQSFFEDRLGGSLAETDRLEDLLVVDYDEAAARHLFEVAAGVDSAVLGEGEILRQVRHAAERAQREKSAGPVLGGLFRHATEVGKRARTETGIARGITSLAHVVAAIANERSGDGLAAKRVVVVGAGEMGEGIVNALQNDDLTPDIVIANRSLKHANALAAKVGARAVALAALSTELQEADVLLTATASEGVIVDAAMVRSVMATRTSRPMLVVDAGMPRDVDPAVADLEDVSLFDVGDLGSYAEEVMSTRKGEVHRVQAIVDDELERYRINVRARSVAPVISALRSRGAELRDGEMERFHNRLSDLEPEELEAVEALTKGLVAKLLHEPTMQLKNAAGTPRGERFSEALRALFDL